MTVAPESSQPDSSDADPEPAALPSAAGSRPSGKPDQRFRPTHRILRGNEFLTCFAEGTRVGSPLLRLVIRANGTDRSRLGLAVSRKVSKRAVVRNRLKRRLREVFRRDRPLVPTGVDIVVLAQPGSAELDFDRLRDLFLQLTGDYTAGRGRPPRPPRPRR